MSSPRLGLTMDEVWDSKEIMEANAESGLRMEELMKLIRAIERAHESRILTTTPATRIVPQEPTEEMLFAAEMAKVRGYTELYQAMIGAAPPSTSLQGWTDDQMIRFASMILIQSAIPEKHRVEMFREIERARGNPHPTTQEDNGKSSTD